MNFTIGIGAINNAIHPKMVLAHLNVKVRYMRCVNRGKTVPKMLRARDWPANAEDANGP